MARNVIGHQCYTFALDACQRDCHFVTHYASVFFFFFQEMEYNFPEPHGDRDGWQREKKRAAEFWTHACSGPIVQGSLSVYPWLCLPP